MKGVSTCGCPARPPSRRNRCNRSKSSSPSVRLNPHQPLGRQVVPGRNTQSGSHAHPARGLDDVDLWTLVGHQRRHDDDIRIHATQERLEHRAARNDSLARPKPGDQPGGASGGARVPTAEEPGRRRQRLPHPLPKIGRLRKPRMQVASVVDRAAHTAGHRRPDVRTDRHATKHLDRALHPVQCHDPFRPLVGLVERDSHVMTAPAQRFDDGIEVAQIPWILEDEEALHRTDSAGTGAPGCPCSSTGTSTSCLWLSFRNTSLTRFAGA